MKYHLKYSHLCTQPAIIMMENYITCCIKMCLRFSHLAKCPLTKYIRINKLVVYKPNSRGHGVEY